jgi:hypothetical protein
MSTHSPRVTLHRQLAAVAIDPQTLIELERHYLAAGTVIEDAYEALLKAIEEARTASSSTPRPKPGGGAWRACRSPISVPRSSSR